MSKATVGSLRNCSLSVSVCVQWVAIFASRSLNWNWLCSIVVYLLRLWAEESDDNRHFVCFLSLPAVSVCLCLLDCSHHRRINLSSATEESIIWIKRTKSYLEPKLHNLSAPKNKKKVRKPHPQSKLIIFSKYWTNLIKQNTFFFWMMSAWHQTGKNLNSKTIFYSKKRAN